MRPTVQVGDPFLEKVLIEACLEAAASGLLDGMQDLGAAGLTSSVMECAARGGTGVEIDVARVPRREDGMTSYEIMLSESQERMLLIVKPENEDAIRGIFERWDVPLSAIGVVTGDGVARVYDGPELAAEVNIDTLVDAPQYRPGGTRPAYLDALHAAAMPPPPDSAQAGRILRALLASPNVASKRAVYRRYDHEVQTRTMVKPGAGDAAVLRLREMPKALALAVDGNGRTAWLDPYTGGAMAVAEACRNVAVSGAMRLWPSLIASISATLRSRRSTTSWKSASAAWPTPAAPWEYPSSAATSPSTNETQGEAVYPTPVVGAVGSAGRCPQCTRRSVRPSQAIPFSCSAHRARTTARSRAASTWQLSTAWSRVSRLSTSTLNPACSNSSLTSPASVC